MHTLEELDVEHKLWRELSVKYHQLVRENETATYAPFPISLFSYPWSKPSMIVLALNSSSDCVHHPLPIHLAFLIFLIFILRANSLKRAYDGTGDTQGDSKSARVDQNYSNYYNYNAGQVRLELIVWTHTSRHLSRSISDSFLIFPYYLHRLTR